MGGDDSSSEVSSGGEVSEGMDSAESGGDPEGTSEYSEDYSDYSDCMDGAAEGNIEIYEETGNTSGNEAACSQENSYEDYSDCISETGSVNFENNTHANQETANPSEIQSDEFSELKTEVPEKSESEIDKTGVDVTAEMQAESSSEVQTEMPPEVQTEAPAEINTDESRISREIEAARQEQQELDKQLSEKFGELTDNEVRDEKYKTSLAEYNEMKDRRAELDNRIEELNKEKHKIADSAATSVFKDGETTETTGINSETDKPEEVKNDEPEESAKDTGKSDSEESSEIKGCPIEGNGGHWEDERGNSVWYPDREEIPKNPKTNPDNLTWDEILNKYDVEGIPFKEGEPDFSEISKGTVQIEDFSENRYGKGGNFDQACEKLAEERGCTKQEIMDWMKENKYTWHERSDCKTMDLVPTEIHGNIHHSGGISKIKSSR